MVRERPGIVDGKHLLVTRYALREPHAGRHRDHVCAQRRELLVDRALRAATEREHGDHGTHADHNAQHREHRAKRIRRDGAERNAKDLRHALSVVPRLSGTAPAP